MPQAKQSRASNARPVLGTVQLGVAYGAANRSGLPTETAAVDILCRAAALGIDEFDTARVYGESERRIGLALSAMPDVAPRVITKLAPLNLDADTSSGHVEAAVEASMEASLSALGRRFLEVVLLHRAANRRQWGGAAWDRLLRYREQGIIGRLGVSVQSPAEAAEALADADVLQLQLPFNALDYRWREAGLVDMLRARPDVTVHVRSVLLQGLLTCAPDARWPVLPGLSPPALVTRLWALARDFGRSSPADLCLAFVRGQDWIDGVVVGVETQRQLEENARSFETAPFSAADCEILIAGLPRCPEALLDPARWPDGRVRLCNVTDVS